MAGVSDCPQRVVRADLSEDSSITAFLGIPLTDGTIRQPPAGVFMASPVQPSQVIRFGAFELDAANGELRKAGIPLKIHPQPFRVLLLLAERPRQTVTREQIQHCLWGENTFVDFERGINFCVNQIRAALGDDAEKPRYVETLPRRGYRFIAPVEIAFAPSASAVRESISERPGERATDDDLRVPGVQMGESVAPLDSPTVAAAGNRKYLFAALAAAVLIAVALGWPWHLRPKAAPIRSLAVLPFENLSGDPAQDYFADGMTEALIAELGKVSALRVISRQSDDAIQGHEKISAGDCW
jgi:DNA-binding winged helix-turn-helix (wHTH) protein